MFHPDVLNRSALSDFDVALALRSDIYDQSAWRDLFARVAKKLTHSIWGSATLDDRYDAVGDALEHLWVELRQRGITDEDLANIARGGLGKWAKAMTRRRAVRAHDVYLSKSIGISWENVYVPGKKVTAIVSGGASIESAASELQMSVEEAQVAHDSFLAARSPTQLEYSNADDHGFTIYTGEAAGADTDYENSVQGLYDALANAFGTLLSPQDIAALVYRAANDDGGRHESDAAFKAELRSATRRIAKVAPSRADVLAALRGEKTEVAA